MGKKGSSAPVVRVALVEENLPDYDKDELQKERELIAKSEACFVSAKLAKEEIERLTKEKKGLSKKDPDFTKKSREIEARIVAHQGVSKAVCKLRHPGCVPTKDSKRILIPKSIGDEINRRNGTKIDFGKLVELEGGEHTVAYVPWWPYLKKDKPVITFYSNTRDPNMPRLAGGYGGEPHNKSGVTIGVGVDLGQFASDKFLKKMKEWNSGEHAISAAEVEALHEKITPYFQLIGGEACKFLREHPLELDERQTNFLDKISQDDALEGTMHVYKKLTKSANAKDFHELTVEQQTTLLSHTYQYGTPSNLLLKAIVQGKRSLIPDIREREYLFDSMPSDKE
ncbi:pesticin C-terminus-like muramidase [Massilia pseudoviolaceinigra]|uniref:pesticin C-terminus-like muramidase n=1 Tax=Massilia pseudoviolaceinigra TaxID=3057165 RepID=UPI002796C280|nr:pesticin C-terminus-like muramidase [Massilia sp. CCM 9206]MDQ1924211.1 pesticin C-terminus-like muramidase [Massilia sp. CCM 9206]